MNDSLLIWTVLFPLLGFFVNGGIALQKARGRGFVGKGVTSVVACASALASFVASLLIFARLAQDGTISERTAADLFVWMETVDFKLSVGFVVDHLAGVMLLIVTGVGFLIHLYSTAYMHDDEAYARYMAYLNLFLFFMLVLVMADSLPLLFVGWEGVGLCSYLLIGFWFTEAANARAGKKAFVMNRIGDFAFLVAMLVMSALLGSSVQDDGVGAQVWLSFAAIRQGAPLLQGTAVLITLCLFAAACGKSAQIPLYVWLPDAMAGPTPVSALIHAATMVTAGIYLVARLGFLFAMAPATQLIMSLVGCATAFMAGTIALTQYDIKKVLAYSTVSQLGFMVMGLGAGGPTAAIFHVMTHAFFKACLFLGAGAVIYSMHHEQDIRKMGGLWGRMPITAVTFLLATLAIAGVPPLSGFFSKDEILYLVYAHAPRPVYWIALLTAGITAFYMMRLFVYAFMGRSRAPHPEHIHEAPWAMTLPLIILAGFSVIGGFFGLPALLGEVMGIKNYLGGWLSGLGQITPHHVAGILQEGSLMLLSAVWGLICVAASFALYRQNLEWTRNLKLRLAPLYRLVANKYFVDELYNAWIIRPFKAFSDFVLYKTFDVKFIDGLLVHGPADFTQMLGRTVSAIQNGSMGRYVLMLLLASLGLMGVLMWGY